MTTNDSSLTKKNKTISISHKPAHHYKDLAHEFKASQLGMWIFLCTEILMFGGLLVLFGFFHPLYPEAFKEGAKHLDWRLGALNTVVLLVSSFTMVLGIYFSQKNNKKLSAISLGITFFCGCVFMFIKYLEYSHKFHYGIYPGGLFSYHGSGAEVPFLNLYFSLYYCLTGLHGIHVLIGMGLILWVLVRTLKGEFSEKYYTPLELVGLFWHLVDVIWIYLFPLLYLIN